MDYVHLHTHSTYSLLDGTAGIEDLVTRARQLGFRHLALTDHDALYGAIEFFQKAEAAGLHPIIGSEVTLEDGTTLVLLVENERGYRNLCRIISAGRLDGGHLGFALSLQTITAHKAGLIILSGGQKGRLWQLARARDIEGAQRYCRDMKARFGTDFHVEIQHYRQNDRILNLRLRDLAHQSGLPLVASNDVHLLKRDDAPLRHVLHAIDRNAILEQTPDPGSSEQYLKSAEEMGELFAPFPDALATTLAIAKRCRFRFQLGTPIFPTVQLPERETGFSWLWKLAFQGAQERYHILTQELIDRLSNELAVINELGFSDYFLIVKDIVDFCAREHIPCVGRGSAGDSLISYVLGITQVDPLRYNLYFERFLNRERSDPPDIDLDICWKSRDRVIDYVYKTYGATRTAMICTFNTFKLRSSIRDVAKVYGFPENEITAITRYLPHYGVSRLTQALDHIPECHHIRRNLDTLETVLATAQRLADFPRHLSIHPGGILIAPDDIRDHTALEVAGKGIVVSQYDMYSIEPLGLVKMDLLGVRSLSIVNDCLQSLKALHRGKHDDTTESIWRYDLEQGTIVPEPRDDYLTAARFPFLDGGTAHLSPLDLRVIPENDPNVIALFRAGQSMACFQTESPSMRGLLRKMRIDGMEDIIISVALIRPGAADSGMKDRYIRRRAGQEPVEYSHPLLAPILEESYGGVIYQEQVMQIGAAVAGFSLAEGDVLRRAMTKARDANLLRSLHGRFLEGARRNGLSDAEGEAVWRFLSNFVGYGFNKAHSCTYGVIAYQTAFLKYYFPVPYMTGVLNNQGGFYSRGAYVEECRRMGIRLEAPDVTRSGRDFQPHGGAILAGLETVRELTEKTLSRLLTERAEAPFRDLYDLLERVRPRQGEIENLIKCGALRALDPNQPALLLRARLYFKNQRKRGLTEAMMHSVRLQPYTREERIRHEMALLEFAVSGHPLRLFERRIDWSGVVRSVDLEGHRGRRVTVVGWLVTYRRVMTRGGDYMKFITIEDDHGLCEAVLFADTYKRYGHLTTGHGPYRITGRVQSRLPGEANLIVEEVAVIGEPG